MIAEQKEEQRLSFNQVQEIVENATFSRSFLARKLGDPRRNINDECGYPETEQLTIRDYKEMYNREAVATRVVNVVPQESWKVQPEVFETEDKKRETEFEKAWDGLGSQLRGTGWYKSEEGSAIWEYLLRLDELSGIGTYGVMLLGIDDGKELNEPAEFNKTKKDLLFLRVFDESLLDVTRWEKDLRERRFGQPLEYGIQFDDVNSRTQGAANLVKKQVHWTRVIHVADNLGGSEIFGVPRQRSVWNRLEDLRKLYGGSAEMYWKGAFPGISFESHPQMLGDVQFDQSDLKTQIEAYQNGLQRWLATLGMHANSLAPQVVDPTPQIDAQIKAICIEKGIPKRVFEGSERGELASSQDSRAWNSRLTARQNNYLIPRMVIPFVDRCINLGVLPEPKEYFVSFPDLDTLTELEQATVAAQRTEALAKYVMGNVQSIIPPFDYLVEILSLKEGKAEAMLETTMKEIGEVDTLMDFGENDEEEEDVSSDAGENRGRDG